MKKPCRVKGIHPNRSDCWGVTELMELCRWGTVKEVRFLLSRSPEINNQDFLGWTALMKAVLARKIEIVKLLLNYNANLWLYNIDHENALMICHYHRSSEIYFLLEDAMRKERNAYATAQL